MSKITTYLHSFGPGKRSSNLAETFHLTPMTPGELRTIVHKKETRNREIAWPEEKYQSSTTGSELDLGRPLDVL